MIKWIRTSKLSIQNSLSGGDWCLGGELLRLFGLGRDHVLRHLVDQIVHLPEPETSIRYIFIFIFIYIYIEREREKGSERVSESVCEKETSSQTSRRAMMARRRPKATDCVESSKRSCCANDSSTCVERV